MDVLMAINPQFVEKIFTGQKSVEFRKSSFRKLKLATDLVFMYCTAPVGKIVGHFSVEKIVAKPPITLWAVYQNQSGIEEKEFFEYFQNRRVGYALEINRYRRYITPIDLTSFKQYPYPPQSYVYIGAAFSFQILKRAGADTEVFKPNGSEISNE